MLKIFKKIYNLLGDNKIMKYIINPGEGLTKPSLNDTLSFNLKFKIL